MFIPSPRGLRAALLALVAALAPPSAAAGEPAAKAPPEPDPTDFEKKVLELGKDAQRPKQLNARLVFETKEGELVIGKSEGRIGYDAEGQLLVSRVSSRMAANVQDGRAPEWKASECIRRVDRRGGVMVTSEYLMPIRPGAVLPLVTAKGEPAGALDPGLLPLLTVHGLAPLAKICRFRPSERRDERVVWLTLAAREGSAHGFCKPLGEKGHRLELAIDEETGAVRELCQRREVPTGEGEQATAKVFTTRGRFVYEEVPGDQAAQLQEEIARAKAAVRNAPPGP
jgi:hypothetical protein